MVCLISTRRELGQSPKECNSALLKCRMVLLGADHTFVYGCLLDFFRFLEPVLALRRVFNPYSKIFISFLDNSSLFKNNYLVDKYPKINFDKVHIIHNFIVIQLSLFIPMQAILF